MLNFEGRTITADALGTLVQTLAAEARGLIWKELLFTDDRDRWDEIDLKDVSESLELGWSGATSTFLNLGTNSKIREG